MILRIEKTEWYPAFIEAIDVCDLEFEVPEEVVKRFRAATLAFEESQEEMRKLFNAAEKQEISDRNKRVQDAMSEGQFIKLRMYASLSSVIHEARIMGHDKSAEKMEQSLKAMVAAGLVMAPPIITGIVNS